MFLQPGLGSSPIFIKFQFPSSPIISASMGDTAFQFQHQFSFYVGCQRLYSTGERRERRKTLPVPQLPVYLNYIWRKTLPKKPYIITYQIQIYRPALMNLCLYHMGSHQRSGWHGTVSLTINLVCLVLDTFIDMCRWCNVSNATFQAVIFQSLYNIVYLSVVHVCSLYSLTTIRWLSVYSLSH